MLKPRQDRTEAFFSSPSTGTTTKPSTISGSDKYRRALITGVFLSTVSGVIFTVNNFVIKECNVIVSDAVLVRGIVQIVLLFGYSKYQGYMVFPNTIRSVFLVIGQGVMGGVSFICSVICVTYMPVTDALVVIFTDPLVTMIMAAIFLRERLTCCKLMSGLFILVGVILVCRPPFIFQRPTFIPQNVETRADKVFNQSQQLNTQSIEDDVHDKSYWIGVAFAVGAVLSGVFHNIIVPQCKEFSSSSLVGWVGCCAVAAAPVISQFQLEAKLATGRISEVTLIAWMTLLCLAISSIVAYCALTRALQTISPSLVSSLRSLEIVLAFCIEAVIESRLPTVFHLTGGILVVASVIAISTEENLTKMKCCHSIRNFLFSANLKSENTREVPHYETDPLK